MMRTTLSLDPDVAEAVQRLRKERRLGLKQIVNEAMRAGLPHLEQRGASKRRFRMRTVSLGAPRLANVDDVAEALALAEGDEFR